jgi:hypothetical protein
VPFKKAAWLKKVFQKRHKAFQEFLFCGFTELHTKLDSDTLLDFANHHR